MTGDVGHLRRHSSSSGLLPEQVRADLARDDVLFLEEGLRGSITHRNYRAPGQYTWLGRYPVRAALAITAGRLVIALGPRYKELDVPRAGPWERVVTATAERSGVVCVSWQVGAFHPDRSGTEEVRLRTPNAKHVAEILSLAAPGAVDRTR
jgi:hypothetical protein